MPETLTPDPMRTYVLLTAAKPDTRRGVGENEMHHIVFVDADELSGALRWALVREPDGTVWLVIRMDRENPVLLKEIWQALSARLAIAA